MSIQFDVRETVGAAPERVFDALTDVQGAGRWMPGLVRMEMLTPGEIRVGSEWRETRKVFGKEATEQFEVTELVRPARLELRVDGAKGTSGRGEFVFNYRLQPRESATELHLIGEIRGLTGFMALLGRLFSGTYRKACARDLVALKAYLENGQP